MNEEVKELWVNALRSGRWLQGYGTLRDITNPTFPQHCCLGVLTELAIESGVHLDVEEYDYFGEARTRFDGTSAFLPSKVKEWAGLCDVSPTVNGHELSVLNDTGSTFEEIADKIEEYL